MSPNTFQLIILLCCVTLSAGVAGVFVFRDRDDLYARINKRVEGMFANGAVEQVREERPEYRGQYEFYY